MLSSIDGPGTTSTSTIGAGPSPTTCSQNTAGSPITGYFTTLSDQSGHQLATEDTPAKYALTAGASYVVTVNGYGSCSFDYWQDTKSTNNQRAVAVTSNAQLLAIYNCGATTTTSTTTTSSTPLGTLTVQSVDLNGNPVNGLDAVVSSTSGEVLQTGYSPLSFQGRVGAQYSVSVGLRERRLQPLGQREHQSGADADTRGNPWWTAYYRQAPRQSPILSR